MALIDKLTAIADAIRGKTGNTEEMTLDQMATEIAGIQAGGGGDETALFVAVNNDTLTDFVATEAMAKLPRYAFNGRKNLKTADLSKLMPIWENNGWDVSSMIGSNCFENCTGLESVIAPEILATARQGSWIGGLAFKGCTSLKEFCTEYPCLVYSSATSAFQNCTALEKAIIPNFTMNGFAGYFNGCTNLKIVDFSPAAIGVNCFLNCTNLKTVIIRTSTMASLANVNAFDGTPFASGGTGGTVYVSQALIESYQTATNWATLYAAGTCNFVAIEGSEYE